jgi:hypothetical protein
MKFYILIACLVLLAIFIPRYLEAQSKPIVLVPIRPVVETDRTFEAIAKCESNNVLTAKNKGSSASGEFQFIWNTWYHYGTEFWGDEFYKKNIWTTDNRDLAWYVYKKYGTKDWNASKACWSKVLTSR